MEDTDYLLSSMNDPGTQKGYLFEVFRDGTCKFTLDGRVIMHIGRYGGLIYNNLGFRFLMYKQSSHLVQAKASK